MTPRAVDDASMAPSWYVTMLDLGLQELLDDPTTPPELAGRLRARLDAIRSDLGHLASPPTGDEQQVAPS